MYRCLILLVISVSLAGCGDPEGAGSAPAHEQAVYTTFWPTHSLASTLSGGKIPVVCPVPEGEDPIFWKPSQEALARYQNAALIVVNGASFEKWVKAASLPQSRVCDTAAGFADRFVHFATAAHSHGGGDAHTHEGVDGHTWLDPVNATEQVEAMASAMAQAFPDHAGTVETKLEEVKGALDRLHGTIRDELVPELASVSLFCSHPAYNYLAKRYGIEITNVELDPDLPLSDVSEGRVMEALKGAKPARILLWEGEPPEAVAKKLFLQYRLRSVEFSPLESCPDWARDPELGFVDAMLANVARLRAVLREL